MNETTLRRDLASLPLSDLRFFEQIDSTNAEALRWLDSGAPDGALVIADGQTAGRGRLSRRWVTLPGSALAFSVIFRPRPAELEHPGLFSPLGALAVAQALEVGYGLQPQVKWPNDVLLDGRKVCGILAETAWTGQRLDGLVVGIGINVLPGAVPPSEDLLFPAVSVEEALGASLAREDLLRASLAFLFAWRERLSSPHFLQAWEARLAYRWEAVQVESAGSEPVRGTLVGISTAGDLRLVLSSGEEVHIYAGDVRLRPAEPKL